MILHLTTFLQGGAGACITDLAVLQHEAGESPAIVCSSDGEPGDDHYPEYLLRLRQRGVPVLPVDSLFKRDRARNLAAVSAVLQCIDIDTVRTIHAHAGVPALAGLLIAGRGCQRIPVVQTMHGWGTRKTPEHAAEDLAVLGLVDVAVVTSAASARFLAERLIPGTPIRVVPCGIRSEPPRVPDDVTSRTLQQMRAHTRGLLLCIGSVTENKNQRALVHALAARGADGWCAAFIGEGPLVPALAAEAARLGVGDRVRWFGYLPDASAYLPLADALVLPSRSEGQGLVVMEAFRTGVPAIVSDVPPLADMVDEGRNGFVFENGSAAGLAAALARLRALTPGDHAEMRTRALQAFNTAQSPAAMYRAYAEVYASARGATRQHSAAR